MTEEKDDIGISKREHLKDYTTTARSEYSESSLKTIKLMVNGATYALMEGRDIKPHHTLLYTLRETLNLTGTKISCDYGGCGRCVVLIDGKPALSCLLLSVDCIGKNITTIEGLCLEGKLDPVQQAFFDYSALQCGICTPSQILEIKALLEKYPKPTEDQIREAISPTICRCGGPYKLVVEAILAIAEADYKNG
ncbi:Aerobic-type carbon monoxide dehydrogenase, small subunit CoxS/CutS-like protein [uncultured Desulfobacterium sp.]|uniref:Aerobic-type carbon monoxide dehydrogenase, small subunit CoxS/CutS-like protein n=1 Tax=uncultured Desulfobacterium sp. TaxID=201089 RepID=A0A445MXR0_9BACT|nr:Aerobic-type carbon monoxide dehydrogenase, small subunit CoxS/CutS-like protein [uncultured Desulfobacterium sp.]